MKLHETRVFRLRPDNRFALLVGDILRFGFDVGGTACYVGQNFRGGGCFGRIALEKIYLAKSCVFDKNNCLGNLPFLAKSKVVKLIR